MKADKIPIPYQHMADFWRGTSDRAMHQAPPPEGITVRRFPSDSEEWKREVHRGTAPQVRRHILTEAGADSTILIGNLIKKLYLVVEILPIAFCPIRAQRTQKRDAFLQLGTNEVLVHFRHRVSGS